MRDQNHGKAPPPAGNPDANSPSPAEGPVSAPRPLADARPETAPSSVKAPSSATAPRPVKAPSSETAPSSVAEDPADSPEVEEGRRPTPVRAVMEGGEDEEKERKDEARMVHDEEKGLDWIVTVSGRSASGILPLRTVPVMELSFAKAEEPERPLRRTLFSAGDLADLSDPQLFSCFKNSTPYQEPSQAPNGEGRQGRKGKNRRGN